MCSSVVGFFYQFLWSFTIETDLDHEYDGLTVFPKILTTISFILTVFIIWVLIAPFIEIGLDEMGLLFVVGQRRPVWSDLDFWDCELNTTGCIFGYYFVGIDFVKEIQCDFELSSTVSRATFEMESVFGESVKNNNIWCESERITGFGYLLMFDEY